MERDSIAAEFNAAIKYAVDRRETYLAGWLRGLALRVGADRLLPYVQHKPGCESRTCITDGPSHLGKSCAEMPKHACTCGLEAVLGAS